MSQILPVAQVASVQSGAVQRFTVGGQPVALARIGDDFFAVGDTCSHGKASLALGLLLPDVCGLQCWKHGSWFSLRTGEAQCGPATARIPVYETVVRDGIVWVRVPEPSTTEDGITGLPSPT
jgi:3-phenylpropionate/trans-cinnamate dioxygenase ferredoxin component